MSCMWKGIDQDKLQFTAVEAYCLFGGFHYVNGDLTMFGFLQDLANDIRDALLIQLRNLWSHTSTAIEGNILTLRVLNLQVRLLINFGAATMKEGLHRIVNNQSPPSTPPCLRMNQTEAPR